MDRLLAFVMVGLALAGSPGPATLSLAAGGAAFGVRPCLGYMTGIVIGMVAVMAITASGVAGAVLAVPGADRVLAVVAALYFAYLAVRIALAPPLAEGPPESGRPSFSAGALLSLINPKGYVAMAALFSGFVLIRERLVWDAGAKIAVLTGVIVAVNLAWLAAGSTLSRQFRRPAVSRAINIGFAVALILSVVLAVL